VHEHDQHAAETDGFPSELPREAKAIAAVRHELDDDLDFRELLEAQLAEAEEWGRRERGYRKRLHHKLQVLYAIFVLADGNAKREALIQRQCDSAGIAGTRASHTTIRLVKLLLRPAEKTAYQYAAALRYAALTKIRVAELSAALEKGGGIAKFAERFWQKASDLRSDADENNTDDQQSSGSDKHRSKKRHDRRTKAVPAFEWNRKALAVYARAGEGDRIRQVAQKDSDGRWRVIKAWPVT